jgi:hypothetical protein
LSKCKITKLIFVVKNNSLSGAMGAVKEQRKRILMNEKKLGKEYY